MTLIDRFICRREGHIPSFTIGASTAQAFVSANTCQRCGRVYDPRVEKEA